MTSAPQFIEHLIEKLGINQRTRILVVGAGNMQTAALFSLTGAAIDVVEIDQNRLGIARLNLEAFERSGLGAGAIQLFPRSRNGFSSRFDRRPYDLIYFGYTEPVIKGIPEGRNVRFQNQVIQALAGERGLREGAHFAGAFLPLPLIQDLRSRKDQDAQFPLELVPNRSIFLKTEVTGAVTIPKYPNPLPRVNPPQTQREEEFTPMVLGVYERVPSGTDRGELRSLQGGMPEFASTEGARAMTDESGKPRFDIGNDLLSMGLLDASIAERIPREVLEKVLPEEAIFLSIGIFGGFFPMDIGPGVTAILVSAILAPSVVVPLNRPTLIRPAEKLRQVALHSLPALISQLNEDSQYQFAFTTSGSAVQVLPLLHRTFEQVTTDRGEPKFTFTFIETPRESLFESVRGLARRGGPFSPEDQSAALGLFNRDKVLRPELSHLKFISAADIVEGLRALQLQGGERSALIPAEVLNETSSELSPRNIAELAALVAIDDFAELGGNESLFLPHLIAILAQAIDKVRDVKGEQLRREILEAHLSQFGMFFDQTTGLIRTRFDEFLKALETFSAGEERAAKAA